jgi:integrase/recombinase XerD
VHRHCGWAWDEPPVEPFPPGGAGFGGYGRLRITMGAKPGPAVRLCTACGQLKSAGQFPPGRGRRLACRTCRSTGKTRGSNGQNQHQLAVHARARDRALRRLAREHLGTYRELYRARLLAMPTSVPRDRARRRAVGQALRAVEQRHRSRYQELYRQELDTARSERLPLRRGRPPGAPDRLSVAPESLGWTWRQDESRRRRRRPQVTKAAGQRAQQQAVRARAVALFREGRSAATVAEEVGVARQTATVWRGRWQSGGRAALLSGAVGRPPAIPDSQLPAIEEALLKGAGAHGFDGEVWTSTRVAMVVQRVTGVRLGSTGVQRLLRDRLGWRFQPVASDATVATAPQPLPVEGSATASLAVVAEAALANLENLPTGRPSLTRSNPPASRTERQDAIAQVWRDEPGITSTALAERFGVSRRTIQYDIQALQERGIQRPAVSRRRRSQRTRAQYAAIYRRFLAWLADELGRPPTGEDLSGEVLARWIGLRASGGGYGGRGLSSASLRLECSALRQLVRQAGRPELAANLHAPRQQAPPPETISPAQYERLLLEPDPRTAIGLRDRAILRLLGDVGLRPSEVCALKLGDIIWSGDSQVPVQLEVAWGKGRIVQLTAHTTAALTGWLPHHPDWPAGQRSRGLPASAPLFVTLRPRISAGQAMTEIGLLYQVLRHAQLAGMPAQLRHPNMLRHYWASEQVARGITPAQLQARGGWRDYRSAQAYYRRPPAAVALAAALGLNREAPPR